MSEALHRHARGTSAVAVAGSPWALARRRLRAQPRRDGDARRLRSGSSSCAWPRRSTRTTSRTPIRSGPTSPARRSSTGKTVPVMQQETEGLGLGVTPIGPTWDLRALLARRRRTGPRRGRAPALRRPQLAADRRRRGAPVTCVIATLIGLAAGFFGGAGRRRAVAVARRRLGLSRLPPRDQPLDRAADERHLARPDHDRSREPVAADRRSSASSTCPTWRGRSAGEVLALREREFVEASIGSGASGLDARSSPARSCRTSSRR